MQKRGLGSISPNCILPNLISRRILTLTLTLTLTLVRFRLGLCSRPNWGAIRRNETAPKSDTVMKT